ncbi:uncharacterized protein [Typha latifolia]|uniref:uncharacterized protein n=1 Tax=Typha latifolia TaxID=4733 RepID=UPI003C2CFE12
MSSAGSRGEEHMFSDILSQQLFYFLLKKLVNYIDDLEGYCMRISQEVLEKLAIDEPLDSLLEQFGDDLENFLKTLTAKCRASTENFVQYMNVLDQSLLIVFQTHTFLSMLADNMTDVYLYMETDACYRDFRSIGWQAVDALSLLVSANFEAESKIDNNAVASKECESNAGILESILRVLEDIGSSDVYAPPNAEETKLLEKILQHVSLSIDFFICAKAYDQKRTLRNSQESAVKKVKQLTGCNVISINGCIRVLDGHDKFCSFGVKFEALTAFLKSYKNALRF